MAYAYKRSVTIDHTQVPSTQSNFPVLVKIDSAVAGTTFKTVANGGHIQNTVTQSGGNAVTMPADLIVTSDSAGTTKIPWEVTIYDGTAGTLWMWVKVASVSSSVDTVFYIFYDDVTVTTQQNTSTVAPSAVWDTTYGGVYHLAETANGSAVSGSANAIIDSTTNANPMSTNGTGLTGVTSPLGLGIQGDGVHDVETGAFVLAHNSYPLTVSAWFKTTASGGYEGMIGDYDGGSNGWSLRYLGAFANFYGPEYHHDGSNYIDVYRVGVTVNDGLWHYVVATFSSAGSSTYIDGSFVTSGSWTGTPAAVSTSATNTRILNGSAVGSFSGSVSEVHLTNTTRSADQVTSEFNNQNAPQTFNTLGAETANSSTFIKTINGLLKASVKTVNGLVIASVKTWNGLS